MSLQMSTSQSPCGRQNNVPIDVHILISRTCEYVSLHGQRDFADGIGLGTL